MPYTPCPIRAMSPRDLPAVGAWISADAVDGHYDRAYANDRMQLRNLLASIEEGLTGNPISFGGPTDRRMLSAWMGEHGGAPIGFAVLTRHLDIDFIELWLMSVDSQHRFQGLGKGMVDALLARPENKRSQVLARCHPHSKPMANLLSHRGFAVLGTGPEGTLFLGKNMSAGAKRAFVKQA